MLIREARLAARLTQAELARRVGCDQSAISRLESNAGAITLNQLKLLSAALQVPLVKLLDDDEVA